MLNMSYILDYVLDYIKKLTYVVCVFCAFNFLFKNVLQTYILEWVFQFFRTNIPNI